MFQRFINDIKKYYRYSIVSAKAQLKSEVANSYLNWIWWILDPLCFMVIYTVMFGYIFNSREPYFSVYIFIGLSIWNFFNRVMISSVKMIKNNKATVSKVYFPKYILIFTKIGVDGFKMMVSFGIVLLMMIFYRIPLSWNLIWFIPILVILAVFTFGCACFMMHYGVYVEDLSNVMTIVLRFIFYATGIFYNIESKIPVYGKALNQYNPVAFLMTSMRKALIYSETPELSMLVMWLFISIVLAVLGVRKIYKEENSYVKAI